MRNEWWPGQGQGQGLNRNEQNDLKYYRALSSVLCGATGSTGRRASRYPASSYAITQRFYNLVNNMGHNGKFVRQMMSSSNRTRLSEALHVKRAQMHSRDSLERTKSIKKL